MNESLTQWELDAWARLIRITNRRRHICRVMGIPFGIVLPSDR